jgi:hypothetical protein
MDSENFVTFFYNKRLGIIKDYCTGNQNMSFYGDEQQDFELIYDFIVVPLDANAVSVMNTRSNFFVDVIAKEIRRKEESIPTYPVQSITAMQELVAAQPIAIDPIQPKEIV